MCPERSNPRVLGSSVTLAATEINFQRLYKIKFVFLGKGSGGEPFVFKQRVSPRIAAPAKLISVLGAGAAVEIFVEVMYNVIEVILGVRLMTEFMWRLKVRNRK